MKLTAGLADTTDSGVAPRAGAWIETSFLRRMPIIDHVAPRAGAWIETSPGSL